MRGLKHARAARRNSEREHRPPKNNAPAATPKAIPPSSVKHLRRDAVWRGDDLFLGRRIVASIVPDPTWPGMWRVKIGDRLTDMLNRSRAHDAALSLAEGDLP
jgi:hypothetical protein